MTNDIKIHGCNLGDGLKESRAFMELLLKHQAMTKLRARLTERRLTDGQFRYIGAALAFIVATIHLFHPERGYPRLLLLFTTDNLSLLYSDPRPILFVLSGLAIITGILLVLWGFPAKPVYATGIALVITYIVGYFAWHLSGHGGVLPGREPIYHGQSPVGAVISHLRNYPIARWSKIAEILLLAVLVVLYRRES